MRIAIVDDLAAERALLKDRLEQQLHRRNVQADILEYESGETIVYSGAKYVRSALKIALTWKSLFRVVENGKLLNRLRNGHLEKSAVTGLFRA